MLAEQHVTRGSVIVAMQRDLISRLIESGRDATEADALLRQFEDSQATLGADRDRLLMMLQGRPPKGKQKDG